MGPVQRFLLYSGVNSVAFVCNLTVAWVLTTWGMQYLLATVCGYVVHLTLVFVVNHTWTFRTGDVRQGAAVLRMCVVHIGSFVLVMTVTPLCVELLGMSYLFARLIAALCAWVWDYLLDSHVTFGVHPFR